MGRVKWEQFCLSNDLMDSNDESDWRGTFKELHEVIEESGHTSIY